MDTALALLTLFIALVTFLPLLRFSHWLIRGLDFPRLQIAVAALILLLGQVFILDGHQLFSQTLIATTLICLAFQLWWILPYTPIWPTEVAAIEQRDADCELAIITSNVLTPNRNAAALIDLVNQYQPDVLVTLESDQWWQDQLDALTETMPYTVKCPLDNLYGMHVYSRLPLEDTEVCYLVEPDVPSVHATIQLRCGEKVRAHFLHPAPPSPTENPESTERDAELIVVAQSVADSTMPIVVTGDLNDVAWSSTTRLFRKISGLLDPRVGRGSFNTFHADYPMMRWPLDHIFHSSHFCLEDIRRLPSIGSDHFPLFARLAFSQVNNNPEVAPDPVDEDEQQWAESITREKRVGKQDVPQPGETA